MFGINSIDSHPYQHNDSLHLAIPIPDLNTNLVQLHNSQNVGTLEKDDKLKQYTYLSTKSEHDLNANEKKVLLDLAYQIVDDHSTNKDTEAMIRRLVLSNIVQRTKFIEGEHLDALPLKQKHKIRDFPSFWRPDFSTETKCRLQMDLFKRIGGLENAPLITKAQYWMGIRLKVLSVVREHRAKTCNFVKQKIVEGKLDILLYYFYN
jgi:hypothetical protein